MAVDYYIKRGDTTPAITATLTPASGTMNLTGAAYAFKMASAVDRTPKVTGVATYASLTGVLAAATSVTVYYQWVAADTDTPGSYVAEFEITFSDTKKATFPNDGFLMVQVQPDLG